MFLSTDNAARALGDFGDCGFYRHVGLIGKLVAVIAKRCVRESVCCVCMYTGKTKLVRLVVVVCHLEIKLTLPKYAYLIETHTSIFQCFLFVLIFSNILLVWFCTANLFRYC